MPTTPGGLPYPASGDPANVPLDMQELAVATERLVKMDALMLMGG